MKKTFEFTLKEFLIILSVLIFSLVTISIGIYFSIEFLSSHETTVSALIGAIGNFSGGLIGGIVAYLVASYQINKTSKFDEIKKIEEKNSILLLIKSELKYNSNIINNCKNDFSEGENLELLMNITSESWTKHSSDLAGKINISLLESLISLNALIYTYKNIEPSISLPHSEKLLTNITKNINDIENEISSNPTTK